MCLNPRNVVVPDFVSGRKVVTVPCGHCLECLKRKQDDITIRIIEESKNWPRLVFFTLTYSESTVHRLSVDKSLLVPMEYETGAYSPETGEVEIDIVDPLSSESREYLELHDYCFNAVCAKDYSDTVKRFREKYIADTAKSRNIKRKDVERLNFKYFFTTEYGPRTLRPHGHGLIWFDFPEHIIKRLFSQWSQRFGYVKYDIIQTPAIKAEDVERISRYVGKYCSKGVFESPLVKDGVAPKCSRLFSKGIGLSYVESKKDWHLGISDGILPDSVYFYGSMSIPRNDKFAYGGSKPFLAYVDLFTKTAARYAFGIHYQKKALETILDRSHYTLNTRGLCLQYSLPRYYKEKIYGTKSLLSRSLSDALAARLSEDYQRKFQSYKDAHPCLTDFQIGLALMREDDFVKISRAVAWRERLVKHYHLSKL